MLWPFIRQSSIVCNRKFTSALSSFQIWLLHCEQHFLGNTASNTFTDSQEAFMTRQRNNRSGELKVSGATSAETRSRPGSFTKIFPRFSAGAPMKRRLSLLLAGLVTIVAVADARESTAGARRSRAKDNTSMSAELEQIKAILQRQQQEIEQLKQQVAARDQALEAALQARNAQSAATQAVSKADTAASQGSATQQSVTALQTGVNVVKASATTTALALQEDKKPVAETEGPPAIRYKGVTITPGGFLATETVWRQHALTADVNTPFNTIPFAGAGQEHLSEFFGSGRPSRLTLLVEGKTENAKFTGYYHTDWLSAGVTSNANQSNSYTNRQR